MLKFLFKVLFVSFFVSVFLQFCIDNTQNGELVSFPS